MRTAARGFVRRHRRDAGYLGWVLRSVGTSSALAVALLGLSAAPARAEIAPFAGLSPNPLASEDVGSYATPALGGLDGDGDLDLVTGEEGGSFRVHYFPEPPRGLLLGAGIALLSLLERVRRRRS